MIYSQKVREAIDFAVWAHEGQKRKDGKTPYIVHPLAVALLLAKAGANEETVIAGLLHDIVEDCSVTRERVESEFGRKVANIVQEITEAPKIFTWRMRKAEVLRGIPKMTKEALMVKSADIVHNLNNLILGYYHEGAIFLKRFNASKTDLFNYDRELFKALTAAWKDNPYLDDLNAIEKEINKITNRKNTLEDGEVFHRLFNLAKTSKDPEGAVSACIVKANEIIVASASADDGIRHAEDLVIEKAKREGVTVDRKMILYTTLEPCSYRSPQNRVFDCTTIIINSGIKNVVFAAKDPEYGKDTKIRFDKAGIRCRQVKDKILIREATILFNSTIKIPFTSMGLPRKKALPDE